MEADADFNAGSQFAAALIRRHIGIGEIKRRMILAGLLLGTVLKAISSKSGEYQYPTIRAAMMIEGGAFFLSQPGLLPSILISIGLDPYWGRIREKYMPGFVAALRTSSMAYFSGTERDLEHDAEIMSNETIPLRDILKDSILKNRSISAYLKLGP